MKLPLFIQQEIDRIYAHLAPESAGIGRLLSEQAFYNKKAVLVRGMVNSVASLDEMDEQTVSTWFLNLPTTVQTTASATYFSIGNEMGDQILVKYPADLDVSAQDKIAVVGIFSPHGVTIQKQGFFSTKKPTRTRTGSRRRSPRIAASARARCSSATAPTRYSRTPFSACSSTMPRCCSRT